MAIFIQPTGEKKEIPLKKMQTLSIKDISNYLQGMVEPLFIGEWWIFKTRNLFNTQYNEEISKTVGLPIYGPCIIAREEELKPYFFFPDELIEDISNQMSNAMSNMLGIPPGMMQDEDKEEIAKIKENEILKEEFEKMMYAYYDTLFQKGKKSYSQINKNFNLLEKNNQILKVPEIKENRLQVIQLMMEFFTKKEEFEKCSKLKELYEYIETKMV